MIRYALIGSGMMGQEHIRNIKLQDDATITGIADPNTPMRDASVELSGTATGYADWREMVSADIADAYLIAAPNDTHHEILLDLLPVNKPVLVEKPLCTTSAHCRDAIKAAAARTAPTWVAMEYRYMPPLQRMMEELRTGAMGDLQMMSIREHRFPFLPKVGDWNRFNSRTGGTLVEKCCHFWDLMRLAMDSDPVRVFASAAADINHQDESYDGHVPDIIDNAFVVIDFENGTRGMLDLCMFAEGSGWQEAIAVTGDVAKAEAFVPGPSRFSADGKERHSEFVLSPRASKLEQREIVDVDAAILAVGDHHGSTYFQHQKFLEMIRSGGVPEVSLEDGLKAVWIGLAAEQSAKSGAAISL